MRLATIDTGLAVFHTLLDGVCSGLQPVLATFGRAAQQARFDHLAAKAGRVTGAKARSLALALFGQEAREHKVVAVAVGHVCGHHGLGESVAGGLGERERDRILVEQLAGEVART